MFYQWLIVNSSVVGGLAGFGAFVFTLMLGITSERVDSGKSSRAAAMLLLLFGLLCFGISYIAIELRGAYKIYPGRASIEPQEWGVLERGHSYTLLSAQDDGTTKVAFIKDDSAGKEDRFRVIRLTGPLPPEHFTVKAP